MIGCDCQLCSQGSCERSLQKSGICTPLEGIRGRFCKTARLHNINGFSNAIQASIFVTLFQYPLQDLCYHCATHTRTTELNTFSNQQTSCKILTEIFPRFCHDVFYVWWDWGEISCISPKLLRSHEDCKDLEKIEEISALMFGGLCDCDFLHLAENAQLLSRSPHSCLPAMMDGILFVTKKERKVQRCLDDKRHKRLPQGFIAHVLVLLWLNSFYY